MGMGLQAVDRALAWVLAGSDRPRRVISAGFSGALQPGLAVGDLVWAEDVTDEGGGRWPLQPAGTLPGARTGRLLTTSEMIGEPERKRQLGIAFGALAVDMETAAIARHCHEAGVLLNCVRVISDDWDTPLSPRLAHLLSGGQVSPWRLAGAVLRQPGLVRELWRLGRHTHFAARRLAEGLKHLFQET
jgi:adenosylhomocysteine nucleosidase